LASLKFEDIEKNYDDLTVVKDLNLEINDEEFIVFVGPSGCGKSTTLRIIAGLEEISKGNLYIGDKSVNQVEPKDRNVSMVFQNYALFPHLNVYDNIAFGLRARKVPEKEIKELVTNAAGILGIKNLLARKPKELSGGQQQRVALGRSIVRKPEVFLMDEPLSNLDANLKVQMRSEITKLHKELKTTTIYVTHDQIEAMTMADRIVIMKDGVIQQVGTPKEVYNYPNNVFVGKFIGQPAMNFINGILKEDAFIFGEYMLPLPIQQIDFLRNYIGQELILGIRPEDIHYEGDYSLQKSSLNIKVDKVELLGSEAYAYMNVAGEEIISRINPRLDIKSQQNLNFYFDLEWAHFFNPKSKNRLRKTELKNVVNQ